MSIVLLCPSCGTRLTMGDDRAGETIDCPRCDSSITVPIVSHSSRPRTTSLPYPSPEENSVKSCGGRSPCRANAKTLLCFIVGGLIISGGMLVLAVRSSTKKVDAGPETGPTDLVLHGSERDGGAGAGEVRPPAIGRVLNPSERKILGTWFEALSVEGGRLEAKTTYKADRTFKSIVAAKGLEEDRGPMGWRESSIGFLDLSGTWLVQDEVLIERILKTEKPRDCPDGFATFLEAMTSPHLKNTILSAKIVSISETHLISESLDTGRKSVAERVR